MKRSLLAVALTSVAACGGDDGPTEPGADGCQFHVIAIDQTIASDLSASDCRLPNVFAATDADSAYYRSYSVQLAAGEGYVIAARAAGGNWDPVLALFGSGSATPLAASDDDGSAEGLDPELVFVAPAGGAYTLRLGGFDAEQLGAFTLSVQHCGGGDATAAGTITGQSLAASDCKQRVTYETLDSSRVDLYRVSLQAGEGRRFTVTSLDFSPSLEVHGPGFGICFDTQCAGTSIAGGESDFLEFVAQQAGVYTLIVASEAFAATGDYVLQVEPLTGAVLDATRSGAFDRRRPAKRAAR